MMVFGLLSPVLVLTATGTLAVRTRTYLVEGPAACCNCHSPMGPEGPVPDLHLAGRLFEKISDFTVIAPNITPAGRVADLSDEELVRAIREGIRLDGSVIDPPMPIPLYRGSRTRT